MSETDMIRVGDPLPRLASVEPANGPFSVAVTWADGARAGRTDIVDLAPMIHTFKVFRPLRDDRRLFASVRLGEDGASIVWGDDENLDVGVESLEDLVEETMTSGEFAMFLKRNNLSLDAAAAQLGISRRLVAYYAKERDVPRHIALACRYLDLTLAPTPEPVPLTVWEGVGARVYATKEEAIASARCILGPGRQVGSGRGLWHLNPTCDGQIMMGVAQGSVPADGCRHMVSLSWPPASTSLAAGPARVGDQTFPYPVRHG